MLFCYFGSLSVFNKERDYLLFSMFFLVNLVADTLFGHNSEILYFFAINQIFLFTRVFPLSQLSSVFLCLLSIFIVTLCFFAPSISVAPEPYLFAIACLAIFAIASLAHHWWRAKKMILFFLLGFLFITMQGISKFVYIIHDSILFDVGSRMLGYTFLSYALISRVSRISNERDEAAIKALRAYKSLNAREDFFKTMSIKLRTPLVNIVGLSDLFIYQRRNTFEEYCARCISSASGHLINGIANLLPSKAISDHPEDEVPICHFHLASMLEQFSDSYLTVSNPRLIISIDADVPLYLSVNSEMLNALLSTFINNAFQRCSEGEIHLHIKLAKTVATTPVRLKFSVRDSGGGITDAEHMNFMGLKEVASPNIDNTANFDFSLCRDIAFAMGGTVGTTQAEEASPSFWFEVVTAINKAHIQSEQSVQRPRWVLLDRSSTYGSLLQQVTKELLILEHFQSVNEVVDWAGEPSVIIVHSDVIMGEDVSAISLLHQLKKRFPGVSCVFSTYLANYPLLREQLAEELVPVIISTPLISTYFNLTYQIYPFLQPFRQNTVGETVDLSGIRILLGEGDNANQKVLSQMLQACGAVVATASHGEQLLQMYLKNWQRFDLIVVNPDLLHISGVQATFIIRMEEKKEERPFPVPVLALSANTSRDIITQCRQAGITAVMHKPISLQSLSGKVYAMLKASRNPI